MSDTYIAAQKRIDDGEAVCSIDYSLNPDDLRRCRSLVDVSMADLKDQVRIVNELHKIKRKVEALEAEKRLLCDSSALGLP